MVRILKDLDAPIEGRDVLIVEDIIDSGLTLQYLLRNLRAREPRSLEVCALLTKPERRRVDLPTRYVGFEIPNRFAIGYGLDHAQRYRNLDYVAALDDVVAVSLGKRAIPPRKSLAGTVRTLIGPKAGDDSLDVPKTPAGKGNAMGRFFQSAAFPILIVTSCFFAQRLISPSQTEKTPTYNEFLQQIETRPS